MVRFGLVREMSGALWLMDMKSIWHASFSGLTWVIISWSIIRYLRGYIFMRKC